MAFLRNVTRGFHSLFQKESVERELDEELREFVDANAAEKMRSGMGRERAYREAKMELGGMEAVKENVREATWESWIETLASDLRFGFRLLRFNPIFAITAILSLALGIGANTAIFQLIDAVRLRTLPVRNPQEIVQDCHRRSSRSERQLFEPLPRSDVRLVGAGPQQTGRLFQPVCVVARAIQYFSRRRSAQCAGLVGQRRILFDVGHRARTRQAAHTRR